MGGPGVGAPSCLVSGRIHSRVRSISRNLWVSIVYYGGLVLVLVATWAGLASALLPPSIATRIAFNTEGWLLALLLAAWIQFARPALRRRSRPMAWGLGVGVLSFIVGLVLLQLDDQPQFRTLNESFLGFAIVAPYLLAKRPLARWLVFLVAGLALLLTVTANASPFVTDYAEALAVVVLVPIGFDLVDRSILEPGRHTALALRLGWYLFLLLFPLLATVLTYDLQVGGVVGDYSRYQTRTHETFIAVLLVELFFTVALSRKPLPDEGVDPA